ncbi:MULTISPECIES: CDP-alcohol phosphatidyltransferase family protein [Azorhizobium]|uniref:CDP-alcohol phosphatidyltransferase family protein n=1 Tax=Azorhizobium TaxID=6 RepID=UPI0002DAB60F|nr:MULTISPECIES: CDP-alcohol phosphatidyltransferase family protein [Azorhizobium]TDT91478.1 phosphatidylglycerophosphate synthase [Azorhizobium sp. AG788]
MTKPTESLFERFHESFLAGPERRLLRWMAARLPAFVMPDHLTAFGVFGALVVFIGYLAAFLSPNFLWLANFGLLIHWYGDSMDGTLARVRDIQRPKYGYFLDQNIDVIGNLLIAAGLGLSPYARLDTALLALTGYHMCSIYVFVRNVVRREFHLAVMGFGPTEVRIGILVMNLTILIAGAPTFTLFGQLFTWCDLVLLGTFVLLTVMFAISFAEEAKQLAREGE